MPVVKNQEAQSVFKSAIALDLSDIRHQAEQIRAEAERQAREIIAAAEQSAEQAAKAVTARLGKADQDAQAAIAEGLRKGLAEGVEKGIAEGREKGRQEALQQASEEFKKIQQSWVDSLSQWQGGCDQLEKEARQDILTLAVRLAGKVVKRTVEVDPRVAADQLSAVLAHVLRPMDVIVRICPEDRPVIEQSMPELLKNLSHIKIAQLIDDRAIGRGGCVVSSGQGEVDATIELQLGRLVRLLLPGFAEAKRDALSGPVSDQHDEPQGQGTGGGS
jgi:flagellar assembly protein FliH